ncbi:MAG: hypothetical protein WDK95_11060 [Syntrophorhabdaceae bacterium]
MPNMSDDVKETTPFWEKTASDYSEAYDDGSFALQNTTEGARHE